MGLFGAAVALTLPEPSMSPMVTPRHFTTTPLPSGVAATVPATSMRVGSSNAPPEPESVPFPPSCSSGPTALAVEFSVTGLTARTIAKVAPAHTRTMHMSPITDLIFLPIIGI